MKTLKCAWCAGNFELGPEGRPKQHKNGAQMCPGSGQTWDVHHRVRTANAAAMPGLNPKPKKK